ncbi:MAG: c-type cytochrome [Steroidobacteraceae bacterium]
MKAGAATASRCAALAVVVPWLILMQAPTQAARADTILAPDPARGAALYAARCGACHAIDDNGAGPRHRGLFGRRAGTQPGYDYSPALRASGLTWNRDTLDRWLADPAALVPGSRMFVQLADSTQDRADILEWLRVATQGRAPRD